MINDLRLGFCCCHSFAVIRYLKQVFDTLYPLVFFSMFSSIDSIKVLKVVNNSVKKNYVGTLL